jgi:hypothetical protein
MMRDEKALRAANILRKYCRERPCADCLFHNAECDFCVLTASRNPGTFTLDNLNKEVYEVRTAEASRTDRQDRLEKYFREV